MKPFCFCPKCCSGRVHAAILDVTGSILGFNVVGFCTGFVVMRLYCVQLKER